MTPETPQVSQRTARQLWIAKTIRRPGPTIKIDRGLRTKVKDYLECIEWYNRQTCRKSVNSATTIPPTKLPRRGDSQQSKVEI